MKKISNYFTKIFFSINYGTLVSFITVLFVVFIVYETTKGQEEYLTYINDGKTYNSCYKNMSLIENALNRYAAANKGKYPKSLDKLTPKYLEKIPFCPQAGNDTYSKSYFVSSDLTSYFFCCNGMNHSKINDVPQAVSDLSYYPAKSNILPMKFIYENGKMAEILTLHSEYASYIEKGQYDAGADKIDSLLKIQFSARENLYTAKAFCLFKTGNSAEAREELKRALSIGFELSEWNKLQSFISAKENFSHISVMLRDYISAGGSEDIDAILFSMYFCGDTISNDEMKGICLRQLNSETSGAYSNILEVLIRGKYALASSNAKAAESYFLAIRDFPCGTGQENKLICKIAEHELSKLK